MTADPVPEPRDLLREALTTMWRPHPEPQQVENLLRSLSATPAGARLLALAAVGLTVERLPEFARLEKVGDHWRVLLYGSQEALDYAFAQDMKWHTAISRDTLPAAVEAALGEQGGRADAAALEARDEPKQDVAVHVNTGDSEAYVHGFNTGHTRGYEEGLKARDDVGLCTCCRGERPSTRAFLTLSPTFGAGLWLGDRLVARIVASIEDSRVTPEEPEPRWKRDARVFVDAVNRLHGVEAALGERTEGGQR